MNNQDGSEPRTSDIMLLDVWKMRGRNGSKDADIAEGFNRRTKGKTKEGMCGCIKSGHGASRCERLGCRCL